MKKLVLLLSAYSVNDLIAQRIVHHIDLLPQMQSNTAYKVSMHEMYENKVREISDDREKTATYATTIEQVQKKVFGSLTNVSGAVRNGKTLFYISQKIPQIFDNLATASEL